MTGTFSIQQINRFISTFFIFVDIKPNQIFIYRDSFQNYSFLSGNLSIRYQIDESIYACHTWGLRNAIVRD